MVIRVFRLTNALTRSQHRAVF